MSQPLTTYNPAPSGVIARYIGSSGGSTTRYYWVQAIYASGTSQLQQANALANTLAGLDDNNRVYVEWNPLAVALGYLVFYTTTSTPPTQGLIFLGVTTAPNFTDSGQSNSPGQSQVVIGGGLQVARAQYNFAVDGGAVSTLTPAYSDTIPANAIMLGGQVNVTTAVTSGGSATVAIGTSAGSAANSILTATGKASLTLDALINTTVTFAAAVKMSAAGQIDFTIAAAALTAGVIEVFVLYVVPINS